jgi:hypothetical protein
MTSTTPLLLSTQENPWEIFPMRACHHLHPRILSVDMSGVVISPEAAQAGQTRRRWSVPSRGTKYLVPILEVMWAWVQESRAGGRRSIGREDVGPN